MTTPTRISLCKHRFALTTGRTGDCTRCGTTWQAVQEELQHQADTIRIRTAHEGTCGRCSKPRMLFSYQREQQVWDETEPPVHWLCMTCWSSARECEETTGFIDLEEAFTTGTDTELMRFVFGATP